MSRKWITGCQGCLKCRGVRVCASSTWVWATSRFPVSRNRWLGQTQSSCQLPFFRGRHSKHWGRKKKSFFIKKKTNQKQKTKQTRKTKNCPFRKQLHLQWEELSYPVILADAAGAWHWWGARAGHVPARQYQVVGSALAVVCCCVCENKACRFGTECPVQMLDFFF